MKVTQLDKDVTSAGRSFSVALLHNMFTRCQLMVTILTKERQKLISI
jgi:hypothetical protein